MVQHHANGTRDGAYVDPLMTRKAAAGIRRDKTFNGPIEGPVYAQPLYVSNGPGGKATLIVVTERNAVVALEGVTGAQLWTETLGTQARNSAATLPTTSLPRTGGGSMTRMQTSAAQDQSCWTCLEPPPRN